MSELSIAEKAALAKKQMEQGNPTVVEGKPQAERKRIPLSVPQRKLEVPNIPGYHLRWIRGTATRLQHALRAGFEYVSWDEVDLNDIGPGGDASHSGNGDMGSRVSIAEGGQIEDGQSVRMFLMKQKMEYYLEDHAVLQKRNDSIADSLTTGFQQGTVGGRADGETTDDIQQRYVDRKRTTIPDFFKKKPARR